MSVDTTAPAVGLTAYVAAEIRAYLGRHSISKAELARRLNVAETWVGKRLNGRTEITLTDVERVAAAVGVAPSVFLPGGGVGTPRLPRDGAKRDPLEPRVIATGGDPTRKPRPNRVAAGSHAVRVDNDSGRTHRRPATAIGR